MRAFFFISAWAAAAFGIAAGIVILTLQGHERQAGYRNQTASYQGGRAEKSGEASTLKAPVAPKANPNPNREEWRSEKDLQAQIDMAQWAFLALIAAGVGVLVTSAGVYLVRETLKETREALAVTREVGRQQSRAYVHVESVKFTWGNYEGERPRFILAAVNVGQTPAKWFECRSKCLMRQLHENGAVKETIEFPDEFEGAVHRWNSLGPGTPLTFDAALATCLEARKAFGREATSLEIAGVLRYATFFDEVYESEFWFACRPVPEYDTSERFEEIRGRQIRFITEKPHTMQRVPGNLRTYRHIGHDE